MSDIDDEIERLKSLIETERDYMDEDELANFIPVAEKGKSVTDSAIL